MKKIISLMLSAVLMMAVVTGCSSEEEAKVYTNEELVAINTEALGEIAEYVPAASIGDGGSVDTFLFSEAGLGFDSANYAAGTFSISEIMTQAHAVIIVQPAEGMEEEVLADLNEFKEYRVNQFAGYLPDQVAITEATIIETLDNGVIVLVMTENAADILESIKTGFTAE